MHNITMGNQVRRETSTIMTTEYPKVYLYRRIVQAKLFIDNNFETTIDLENIADEAHFSKFHFIRLFKKVYNKTPHQYLTFVRIERAMQLLKNNVSIIEACHAVGFESLSSFTGLFKRTTGTTPLSYSTHHQNLKKQIQSMPLKFIPGCFVRQHGFAKK